MINDYSLADLKIANAWTADAFLNCLDFAEARVTNFDDELDESEMCDGLTILAKAAKLGESSIGSQRIDAEAAFNSCIPFAAGADHKTTNKAANDSTC